MPDRSRLCALLRLLRRTPLFQPLRAIHERTEGIVTEQLLLTLAVVLPVAACAPYAVVLLVRYFYRIAVTVSGPFP